MRHAFFCNFFFCVDTTEHRVTRLIYLNFFLFRKNFLISKKLIISSLRNCFKTLTASFSHDFNHG